jgi:hypothetical protein
MPRSRVHYVLRDRLIKQAIPGRRVGSLVLKLAVLFLLAVLLQQRGWSDTLALSTASGITISGGPNNYTGSLGSGNAFGISAPTTALQTADGYLYATTVTLKITGASHNSDFYAHLSANTSTAIKVYSCPYSADCALAANFTQLSVSPSGYTTTPGALVASSVANNGSRVVTVGIEILSGQSGGSAVPGLQTPTIHFYSDDRSDTSYDEAGLALSITIQSAIRLTLGPNGGLTPTVGSTTNYLMNFGSVNALGVGDPAAGVSEEVDTGGCRYSTPYLISPSFADQTTSNATLKYYNSTKFSTLVPSPVDLEDSDESGASYTVMPTTLGTAITKSAPSGTDIKRRIAVYIRRGNGSNFKAQSYSAIVTYQLTAQ